MKRIRLLTPNFPGMLKCKYTFPLLGSLLAALSSRATLSLLTAMTIFSKPVLCTGGDLLIAGNDSSHLSGLFSFRYGSGTNTEIHLVEYTGNEVNHLFKKLVGTTVKAPICLSNGIVAVKANGVVRKFNLNGDLIFAAKPEGISGALGLSGKVNESHIFITETTPNPEGDRLTYNLYILEVSGVAPIIKTKSTIIQPFGVTRNREEIIVVGRTNTVRVKIPKELRLGFTNPGVNDN